MNKKQTPGRGLKRTEMKKITGGSTSRLFCLAADCQSDQDCSQPTCYCNLTTQICKKR